MGRDGEETCDELIGCRQEQCPRGAREGVRPDEGQHEEAGRRTEPQEDSEDLAPGRGSGECLIDDTPGPEEAGRDVITFGIDVEYPKEELTMMDYTWVLDQVKDANATNDLYAKTLIEFCTEEDSQLGQVASEREDARNIRITRKDADFSKKAGLDFALK